MTFFSTVNEENKSQSCENIVEEDKENDLNASQSQFCKPISINEYHTQKFHLKSQSLRDLLDAIVHDDNIGEREKAKRLKNVSILPFPYYSLFVLQLHAACCAYMISISLHVPRCRSHDFTKARV